MESWLFISLLLSAFMIHEAQGMSLRRGSLPDHYKSDDIHQRKIAPILTRNNDGVEEDEGLTVVHQVKKISGTKDRKLLTTNLSEKHHRHWLPRFHEDYYGTCRKLIVPPTSSTTKTAKNVNNEEDKALSNSEGSSNKEKMGKKEGKLSVNSSSQNQEVYPDVVDIAGMDYSQSRRRPPIHN